jgi:hypothetical protein
MNDISKRFASYLMDDYKIKGTTEEDVDKAINKIMTEALDVPWIAEQLTDVWDRYEQEILDCKKEDYENR